MVLQLLCEGSTNPPEWLVFVPQSMSAIDLDAVILRRAEPGRVAKYQTPTGDVVYVGTSNSSCLAEPLTLDKD
jgi:hypothetical protein